MFQLHEKIKKLRLLKGFSQQEVAQKLGMSAGNYSRIESGKTGINIDLLKRICVIFDTALSELIDNSEHMLLEACGMYAKSDKKKQKNGNKEFNDTLRENNLLLQKILHHLEEQSEINKKLLEMLKRNKK